ncbi:cytochrome c5 family protein [Legionella sp. km772]|uniref:c-type cytochrome n=1 Tax=Legionella sp. km772 TaxID=2498111 RepID=UPI000F8F39EE|nr:c-type cytochrome [Legionella sp. km772]RUR11960.1 cytochrome c5 family protein [Legionella sp. km772]
MRRSWPVYLLFLCTFSLYASTHRPQDFLNQIKGSTNEGAQIYQHFCVNCHASKPIIPLGAPRFGEQKDWNDRLKQDIKIIFKHTEEGMNAMPPRGGCFECSDEQLALALVEMLPSKAKKRIYNELVGHKKITK